MASGALECNGIQVCVEDFSVGPIAGVRVPLVKLFSVVDSILRGEIRASWVLWSNCRDSCSL